MLLALMVLAGCSTSRYSMDQDTGPDEPFDAGHLESLVPQYEPYSRGGNKSPYEVWGKTYHVLKDHRGYEATGKASWYGKKFHGHKTSNGEIFDMYKLSAAHRTLPLPSYVKVTNLANGRSVIVRVNDRGPFHSERLIDLSYAAARKLGYANKGTTRVHIAAVNVGRDGQWTVAGEADNAPAVVASNAKSSDGRYFVQVAAFNDPDLARRFQQQVRQITDEPVRVTSSSSKGTVWHRVRVGPFASEDSAELERRRIEANRLGDPILVTLSE
ncbi:septal ring lytic transglycosylase RlpA family protein [Marinobacteraceae bacterium S3BR75-40.1]